MNEIIIDGKRVFVPPQQMLFEEPSKDVFFEMRKVKGADAYRLLLAISDGKGWGLDFQDYCEVGYGEKPSFLYLIHFLSTAAKAFDRAHAKRNQAVEDLLYHGKSGTAKFVNPNANEVYGRASIDPETDRLVEFLT